MTRTTTGTRGELCVYLRNLAEGWKHLGDEPRAAEAMAALEDIENGADQAQAGHTLYAVSS